jgi:hypothetical protein
MLYWAIKKPADFIKSKLARFQQKPANFKTLLHWAIFQPIMPVESESSFCSFSFVNSFNYTVVTLNHPICHHGDVIAQVNPFEH